MSAKTASRRRRTMSEDVRRGMAAAQQLGTGQAEANAFVEEMERVKQELARRWEPLLEGISDDRMRKDLALLLENQKRYARGFMEDLTTGDIATFDKFAFPIIRALFPQLAATDLVSVQPMSGPASLVFFLDYIYGTTKGTVTAGTKLFENPNAAYSSSTIDEEVIATGAISADAAIAATLAFTPIKPGTVTISHASTAGTQTQEDDGSGTLVGDTGTGGSKTINYTTGAISTSFSAAVDAAVDVITNYDYELENQENIPQVDIVLSKAPVVAEERKLRTRWSFEAQQDLKAIHGLDAETELTAEVTTELRFEIDLQIITAIWDAAFDPDPPGPSATTPQTLPDFNKNPPPGVSFRDHKSAFKDILIAGASIVNFRTARANPNWMLVGYDVADLIETQEDFVPDPNASFQGRGVRKIGDWSRWAIYLNPAMDTLTGGTQKSFLLGYKGQTFFDTGYVYAPYVPLYATPTVSLDDFKIRKGIASRYGTKLINGDFYLKGDIVEE